MLKRIAFLLAISILCCYANAFGQSAAQLQRILPYSEAVRAIPGLTYADYLKVINQVAKENSSRTVTMPQVPTYVPPPAPVYVPPTTMPVMGTTTTIGNNTFTNWSDGSSATTTKLGNNTFTNFNDGMSATRTQLGDFGFTNFSNGASATSNQIGQFGFTNYSTGLSSITTRIGNFSFTNFNDGSSATTTTLGGMGFTTVTPTFTPNFMPTMPTMPMMPTIPSIALPPIGLPNLNTFGSQSFHVGPRAALQRVMRLQKGRLFSCPHECPHGRGLVTTHLDSKPSR